MDSGASYFELIINPGAGSGLGLGYAPWKALVNGSRPAPSIDAVRAGGHGPVRARGDSAGRHGW